jgi:predicted membrane protein
MISHLKKSESLSFSLLATFYFEFDVIISDREKRLFDITCVKTLQRRLQYEFKMTICVCTQRIKNRNNFAMNIKTNLIIIITFDLTRLISTINIYDIHTAMFKQRHVSLQKVFCCWKTKDF